VSLRPEELRLIAEELTRELSGGVIQKIHAPTTTRVYLEVRVPGRSVSVLVCSDHGFARISAVDERPANPATPPTWQSVLRTDLMGAKFADAEALLERRTVILHFSKAGKFLNLILECTGEPAIIFCTGEAQIRSLSLPNRPGLRVGQRWTPLEEQPVKPLPSRLAGDHVFLRLAHAAEALLSNTEQKTAVDARRAPILAKLKKLKRTVEKVRAESDRTAESQQLRLEGELLTQNLHLLKRGLKVVRVLGYDKAGEHREIELTLDPDKTPQQNVEQRFHRYRRLVRGGEIASKRLLELEAEGRALEAELAALENAAPVAVTELAAARAKPRQQEALPPFREYVGHGQRIWVGRGSAHNDALTFHVARPFHLWLHARGVPGAHVVVPLEKNATLAQEVLLDAAHLAAHHSDAKGEPRVEVSYTSVKFVHKPKDAAAGAVTFTREKTLLLRLEPDRLKALLSSEKAP
jgi:predicted ribosome quality control (RQC) complex YloA/Tae2 family protein